LHTKAACKLNNFFTKEKNLKDFSRGIAKNKSLNTDFQEFKLPFHPLGDQKGPPA